MEKKTERYPVDFTNMRRLHFEYKCLNIKVVHHSITLPLCFLLGFNKLASFNISNMVTTTRKFEDKEVFLKFFCVLWSFIAKRNTGNNHHLHRQVVTYLENAGKCF